MVPLEARYFDNPEAFLPERWKSEAIKQLPKYAYFPFGGGPRLCIGNSFAMMEACLVLATLAQRCRFTLVPGPAIRPAPAITLKPERGIQAVVRLIARRGAA